MARRTHRHHQGYGPPYTGLHTGRHRNPDAGMLVIHRPGQPDEILTTAAFRRRVRAQEQGADLSRPEQAS